MGVGFLPSPQAPFVAAFLKPLMCDFVYLCCRQGSSRRVTDVVLTKGMYTILLTLIETILKILTIIVPLLVAVAYVTLAERKVLASMQLRTGPNVVGIYGILQPLADGIKLFTKETILPGQANLVIFIVAPILALTLSLAT